MSRLLLAMLAAVLLAGCAVRPAGERGPSATEGMARPATTQLACEGGLLLRVDVRGDDVLVQGGPGGPEVLLRDAGGVTATHTVYSSERMRLELGVGPDARDALVHLLQPEPRDLRCRMS